MKNISISTAIFIKKWNQAKSESMRESLFKNHIAYLFINKDMIVFIDEFASRICETEERIRLLLYCKKILLQNEVKIDEGHYKAFQEEYDKEMSNDINIRGIDWIDAEVDFIKQVGSPELILMPVCTPKMSDRKQERPVPDASDQSDLLTLTEMLKILSIGKSTFDRRRKEGLPCFNDGKKIYAKRDKFWEWMESKANCSHNASIHFSGK